MAPLCRVLWPPELGEACEEPKHLATTSQEWRSLKELRLCRAATESRGGGGRAAPDAATLLPPGSEPPAERHGRGHLLLQLQHAAVPGGLLPVPLQPQRGSAARSFSPTRFQVVLLEPARQPRRLLPRPPLRLPHRAGRLLAALALHAAGLALALALWVAREHVLTAWAGARPGDVVASHLRWFMTARPAGVKLHPPLCDVLGSLGLSYVQLWTAVISTLPHGTAAAAHAAVAAAFAAGGLARGLLAVRLLAQVAGAPAAVAYVALAAALRWHSWAVLQMWRVIRGDATLPRLRHRLRRRRWWFGPRPSAPPPASPLRRQQQGAATGAAAGSGSDDGPDLQQLTAASLLLPTALLLLPTTAWFYAYALLLHGAAAGAAAALLLAARLAAQAGAAAVAPRKQLQQPEEGGEAQGGELPWPELWEQEFELAEVRFREEQLSAAARASLCHTVYVRRLRRPPEKAGWQQAVEASWRACGFGEPAAVALAAPTARPVGLPHWAAGRVAQLFSGAPDACAGKKGM